MDQRYRLRCIVILGLALNALVAAHAQSLPAGTGKADFQRICSGCHSVDRATSQRMTRTEWAAIVSDMVARGAQGSSAELDAVVGYLSTNFGKSNPSASPAEAVPRASSPAPAPLATKEAPLSATEISEAKRLIQRNGCLSCHRLDDAGSYLGPYLDDVGAHRSLDQPLGP